MSTPAHAVIGATDVGPVDVENIGHGPVKLGSILFTMVDPHRGHEVAYNRWYERDHLMAGCTVGPYCFQAKRWVATRAHKDLRFVAEGGLSPDPVSGSYLSLYWLLKGYETDWNRWAFREFKWLHENGRMFPHRDHVHTLLYTHDWAVHRDDDGVPVSLALDHPYKGVAVVAGEVHGEDRAAFDQWAQQEWLPSMQREGPVAMTLSFSGVPLQIEAKDVAKDTGAATKFLHISFLQEDPLDCWGDTFAKAPSVIEEAGMGRVTWAGGFIPTIVGTDTYTDVLW